MKKLIFLSLFVLMLGTYPNIIHSQTLHIVEVSDFVFTIKNLTITVNDTVRWVNLGGFHNVVADDNSFTSGPASTANWVYENVFTSAGDNPYFCVAHGGPGGTGMAGVVNVLIPVSVSDQDLVINNFKLEQNYPNPFNPSTVIRYTIAEKSNITLTVYNSIGRIISTLLNEVKPQGTFTIEFDASTLSSGIYYIRLQAGSFNDTRKMVLLR